MSSSKGEFKVIELSTYLVEEEEVSIKVVVDVFVWLRVGTVELARHLGSSLSNKSLLFGYLFRSIMCVKVLNNN